MNLDLWDMWDVEARQRFPQVYPGQRGVWTTSVEFEGLAKVNYISVCSCPQRAASPCGTMALSHSVKERTISENSLIILLQGLQGQITTVDLRDESVARGRIDNVDAFMNIRLANVTYTDRWGHQVELDDLFVTGRNVRYVHIPDGVNITATIEQQLQIIHRVRNFGGKGQGRREFPSKRP